MQFVGIEVTSGGSAIALVNVPYTEADDVEETVTWYDIFTRAVGA